MMEIFDLYYGIRACKNLQNDDDCTFFKMCLHIDGTVAFVRRLSPSRALQKGDRGVVSLDQQSIIVHGRLLSRCRGDVHGRLA